jgi:acetamidase/formamidase
LSYSATNVLAAATDEDLSRVHTVPDPYYVTSQFEQATDVKIIKFVNLPADCIIRIYSSSGVLVDMVEHHSATFGGAEDWNVRNRNNQVVASGVYFYHIEAGDARRVGRFTIVNFAQ